MAKEIERKFAVKSMIFKDIAIAKKTMIQAYIFNSDKISLRIRIEDNSANINLKESLSPLSRKESEMNISISAAKELIENLNISNIVEKERYIVKAQIVDDIQNEKYFEVDVFHGDNEGLIVAEIELDYEEQEFIRPEWLGEELSYDTKYLNTNLAKHPYKFWK